MILVRGSARFSLAPVQADWRPRKDSHKVSPFGGIAVDRLTALGFASLLLVLASVFGYLNYRFLRLPGTIGVLVIALAASLAIIVIDAIVGYGLRSQSERLLASIDLPHALFDGALAFLLFAGGMHVNLRDLWNRKWAVLALATVGVLIATGLFGLGMWTVFSLLGAGVPFAWCLVLGAILAPTDPIAVLVC